MTVYLIQNEEEIGYYTDNLFDLENTLFADADEGEKYTITKCEMTKKCYDNLSEFNGF